MRIVCVIVIFCCCFVCYDGSAEGLIIHARNPQQSRTVEQLARQRASLGAGGCSSMNRTFQYTAQMVSRFDVFGKIGGVG